jgi:hypothetical protein
VRLKLINIMSAKAGHFCGQNPFIYPRPPSLPCPRSAHRLMTGILRKGQRAVAMAFAFPDPEKGGRGKRKTVEDPSTLFSAKRFQQARYVYGVPILRLIRRYD